MRKVNVITEVAMSISSESEGEGEQISSRWQGHEVRLLSSWTSAYQLALRALRVAAYKQHDMPLSSEVRV